MGTKTVTGNRNYCDGCSSCNLCPAITIVDESPKGCVECPSCGVHRGGWYCKENDGDLGYSAVKPSWCKMAQSFGEGGYSTPKSSAITFHIDFDRCKDCNKKIASTYCGLKKCSALKNVDVTPKCKDCKNYKKGFFSSSCKINNGEVSEDKAPWWCDIRRQLSIYEGAPTRY